MVLIVGLGNPGKKYEKTRHNLGFMVVEVLAKKWLPVEKRKWQFDQKSNSELIIHNSQFLLVKPQTFMNASGYAVKKLASSFELQISDIYAIYDDLDLPLGKLKIRKGGGTAGHRGLESIVKELEAADFVRFRLGIGHPGPGSSEKEVESYVLSPFGRREKSAVRKMIKKTLSAIETALKEGLEVAMNRFN